MSNLDEIEPYEPGAEAIRAATVPQSAAHQQSVFRRMRTLQAPAQESASFGTTIGTKFRRTLPVAAAAGRAAANAPIRNFEAGINTASAVPRAVGGVLRDVAAAASGQPAANQGQPIAPVRLPRLFSGAAQQAAVTGVPGAAQQSLPQNYSPGPNARGRTFAGGTPTAAAPAAAAMNLQPGDTNTFTGSDGVTQAVPGLLNAQPAGVAPTTQVATTSNNAQRVQATTARTLDGVQNAATSARGQIGAGLNPMSDQGELMRRLEISQGSFKGSPSARAAVARALLGQMEALTDATGAGQQGSNQVLTQGAGLEAGANEAFARRRLDADQFNVNADEQRQVRAAALRAPRRLLEAPNGRLSALSDDGRLAELTNADGSPFQQREGEQERLSADSLLQSYTERVAAIEQSLATPQEKRASLDQINNDPLYAGLRGRPGGAPYPEGTRLRGRDGKAYVVRNGEAVPAD